jgi:hypothetical protein
VVFLSPTPIHPHIYRCGWAPLRLGSISNGTPQANTTPAAAVAAALIVLHPGVLESVFSSCSQQIPLLRASHHQAPEDSVLFHQLIFHPSFTFSFSLELFCYS